MNTKTFLAISAAAVVGFAAAETCSPTDQTTAYSTLASVLTLSSFQGCADDSGFSLLYSTALPDDAQYVKMCASDNCKSLIESVAGLNPPNCDLTVPTSGLVLNVVDLTSGFSKKCSSSSSTSNTASSAATSRTTEALLRRLLPLLRIRRPPMPLPPLRCHPRCHSRRHLDELDGVRDSDFGDPDHRGLLRR
ncbi:hypothetical protein PInf_022732 [Phytophthora infestans]|nr:hypothetical protein PInf_022732 [Phytophthora infestans]